MADLPAPSKSQVKRAGSLIRKCMRGDIEDPEVFQAAANTMETWRRAHYPPLLSANNGLRSFSRTVGVPAEVTQRLKRRQTILEKLGREPTLDLSRMQDIGGCRAVVNSIEELRTLEARIKRVKPPIGYSDYITHPRASGYRAVHVVVQYQGRAIEIQLRTRPMHTWALAAEEYSGQSGLNLKQDGTHPVQIFLEAASRMMAFQEAGEPVPEELTQEHEQKRLEAAKSLYT